MTVYIAGFICALILAALVVAWIAYCMFVRERHKSESYQYNISDLQHRNYLHTQEEDEVPDAKKNKEITAGFFYLPSRHKDKDDYVKRPDYPEGPVSLTSPSTEKLIEMLNESADVHYKDGIYEVDSHVKFHSDV
ncbi:hypothetical protein K1T71_010236 [Dendrolimus kikuchii]|uniref:Uncharacterized protein n=1 Tax=Dendrolimus kikuchii TaxID=765133 RepID=A0ACC1CR50_9NEOP|nr:hypothetical protein K1T71_010236 [Dendrolimus kikuchii]